MKLPSLQKIKAYIFEEVHIAPLAVFRVLFGLLMFGGIIRFAGKGWIESLYIQPEYYFSYFGFEWIKPLGAFGMYSVFFAMGAAALFMALGLFYRFSAIAFFLTFTYVELIDKSNYLNHYYFVSIVAFLMIWLPAGKFAALDVFHKPSKKVTHIPRVFILTLQFQLGIVYFFAGVAKLNYDWLCEAMPLRIWLQPHTDMPLLGYFMDKTWAAYLFSWFGAIYDLCIPFLLLNQRTRPVAYFFVIVFHLLTWFLFQIGLFPIIMIFCTLIFFSESFHISIVAWASKILRFKSTPSTQKLPFRWNGIPVLRKIFIAFLILHVCIQLLMPFRYLLYPGKLFWTEQGYRFSWRVMLMEKAGKAFFFVTDTATGRKSEVSPAEHLTANQEKMMATQPDMLLQYAHFLKTEYEKKGLKDPKVTVSCYVTLNGSGSRKFINDSFDLTTATESFRNKEWILPFKQ